MLKEKIRKDVGIVRSLLEKNKTLSFQEIVNQIGHDEEMIMLCIGWLAYENKIVIFPRPDGFTVALNHTFSEMYY